MHAVFGEFANVGAGLGGGFENTKELCVMKYEEAVSGPDGKEWEEEIDNKHARFTKNKVCKVVPRNQVPKGVKPLDTTWACKKKSNGTRRGRLNARGFKQVEGIHYDGSSSIHSPVTNAATIQIILIMMLISDVHGAFLHGLFSDG